MPASKFKWLITVEGGNRLLDIVIDKLQLKNDAALARAIGVAPPVISKYRHGKLLVGATSIISIQEETDMPIAEIRAIAEQVAA